MMSADEGSDLTTVEGRIDAAGLGMGTLKIICLLGVWGYGFIPSFWIVQPLFLNPKMEAEFGVDRKEMGLTGSLFFLGWAVGAVTITKLADTYGRKKVVFAALAATNTMSLLTMACPIFPVYAIVRMCLGGCLGGFGAVSYIHVVEFLPSAKRGPITVGMNVTFSLGCIILTIFAYCLQSASWRTETFVDCLPGLLLLFAYPIIPESPRWLHVKGRLDEAQEVLKAIEAGNGVTVVEESLRPPDSKAEDEEDVKESFLQSLGKIMRPSLRVPALALFFTWFSVTLVYYGLAFSAGDLAGSVYQNSIMLAMVELPAYVVLYFSLEVPWIGRKGSQMGAFFTAGVSLLLIVIFKNGPIETMLAMVGKLGATAAFVIVYIFAGELFPTNVRASGLGMCNIFARAGGILAPEIITMLPTTLCLLMFGVLAMTACGATSFISETLGQPLKDVMDEDTALGTFTEMNAVGGDDDQCPGASESNKLMSAGVDTSDLEEKL